MEHGIRRISNALCASASAAALVVCCVSCAHSTTEDVGYLEGFTTSGAFLVVRLSSQGIRNGLPPDTANGYLVAFQQDGSMSAAWTQAPQLGNDLERAGAQCRRLGVRVPDH